MREYFPYADDNVGPATQKASTCALFPHLASHCCQKAPWSWGLFLEETTSQKQDWSVQAHVRVPEGRVEWLGCPSGMSMVHHLQRPAAEGFAWVCLEREDLKSSGEGQEERKCWWHVTEQVLKMSAHLHAMRLKGKTKGRGTCSRPKSKDSLQSPDKCFKPADAMLLLIPEMWPVIVRVNRGSENFLNNYCSDIFSFMSCCWHFNWFSSPHLQCYPRCCASPYPLSWTADLHQEIQVCTIASLYLSIQWKSVLFFPWK